VPDDVPTLDQLRPAPGSGEDPVHRRTIEMNIFWRDDYFAVVGTLRDERPWAGGDRGPRQLHAMELGVVVRRADMVIVDAAASMETYPHAECRAIEPRFNELIGLCVARGYTSAVQERFGRERGCSHLEFLARAIGPAVIQAVPSTMHWRVEMNGEDFPVAGGGSPMDFLADSCHVWAEGGVGQQKVQLGWRPLKLEYPAPPVAEVRRRVEAERTGEVSD
jgi:hypothetical protein